MNRSALATATIATILTCAASIASAQDTNYWTIQYGTRGELLGGVVVGSAVDLSSTFYNPGSFALVKDPKALLTATVFGMETLKVTDVDPGQEAVTSRRTGTEPSLFAIKLPMNWLDGRWAFTILTRQKLDFKLAEREGLVIGLDTGSDSLSIGSEILYDQYVTEQWGGLTWSKKAGDKIGIGATLYGVYRSQERSRRQTVEAVGAGGYGASLVDWTDIDYFTFRFLAKLGIEGEFGNTSVGLAMTSRSLTVLGSGSILVNRVVIGDTNLDGIDDSAADVTHGKDLDAEYISPFSFALGAAHHFTNITVHATGEYFMPVDPYNVMETPAAHDSPGVTTYPAAFQHALKEVFNWGVGVEKRFSDKTTGYVSFITDRSASRSVPSTSPVIAGGQVEQYNVSVSTWDIYHVNGGVAFTIRGTDLTVGGGFAWGSAPLNATPDSEGILPPTIKPDAVSYSRIKAILGIAL